MEDEDEDDDVHALTMARVALDLMDDVTKLSRDSFPSRNISLRIAINTGRVSLGHHFNTKIANHMHRL